jgi:catechol 2,3-dioxygenase-like lactoylglutathione lyase family enzyme
MSAKLGAVTPVLRVFDEAAARAFYVDFLGFTVNWEHRFEPGLPLYMEVAREPVSLHLSEQHGDGCPDAAVRIVVEDLEALYEELEALYEELDAGPYAFARPGI